MYNSRTASGDFLTVKGDALEIPCVWGGGLAPFIMICHLLTCFFYYFSMKTNLEVILGSLQSTIRHLEILIGKAKIRFTLLNEK